MAENRVVPEFLDGTNYDIWSSWMKMYLVSQDLWDVIEEEEEEEVEVVGGEENGSSALLKANESYNSSTNTKSWRKKNALVLHAIHMSCTRSIVFKIGTLESAKEVWYSLRSININQQTVYELVEKPLDDQADSESEADSDTEPFIRATMEEDLRSMQEFLESHPRPCLGEPVFPGGKTALHQVIKEANFTIAQWLVEQMTENDLEIQDESGYTAFAHASNYSHPNVLKLLQMMVSKSVKLPTIGEDEHRIPVVIASWKGFINTTRYLYSVTDASILRSENGYAGVHLLINCINSNLFDIASELVEKFPDILKQDNGEIYPVHALAKMFSTLQNSSGHKKSISLFKLNWWVPKYQKYMEYVHHLLGVPIRSRDSAEKSVHDQAKAFLELVCAKMSTFDIKTQTKIVCEAMVEAAKNGTVEFITEMVKANPKFLDVQTKSKGIFWHAVENRQENVFNIIHWVIEDKDSFLSHDNKDKNNILHLAAQLAPLSILDRTSGPALQMQRELQWFKEVWNVAKPRYREDLNKDMLTPRQLFSESHKNLIDAGEKAMKDIAQSSTVVGALIVTVMFAAAFTLPGGNNQDTGIPLLVRKALFKIFMICDALSLYSSTTSVLVFLGILTSRYAEDDFLLRLPRKLMIGLVTLSFSITTMMVSFCAALALMIDGQLQFILPIVLLACVPIILFLSSILPLLREIFMSTFGPSIFDKSTKSPLKKQTRIDTKLSIKKEDENIASNNIPSSFGKELQITKEGEDIINNNSSRVDMELPNKKEDNNIMYSPCIVDEIV